MVYENKSREELIAELRRLRHQVAEMQFNNGIDLYQQKLAEEALHNSEERFSKIFSCSPVMIAIHSMKDNRYIDVNQKFIDVLGYSRQELLGHTPVEFNMLIDITDEQYHETLDKLIKAGIAPVHEFKLRTKSGKTVFVLWMSTLIAIGDESCRVAILQDITEQKQAEMEKVRLGQRFETAFNDCPAAMIVYHADSGVAIDVNPAFEVLFKISKAEMAGRTLEQNGFTITSVSKREAMHKDLLYTGRAYQELDVRLRNGTNIKAIFSITLLSGEEEKALASILDVTELRRMESEMRRFDQLNLVGEMAAGIGHEVRNPMTTVKGFLQLYRDKSEFAEYRETFDIMVSELDRANLIISEYLSMAKNKSVSLEMKNLNKILRSLLPLIQADGRVADKYIRLGAKKIPDLLLDENEIRQLVLNLVRNGLDAITPGESVDIWTYQEGDDVVLAIEDSGPGIKPEVLEKLGTPFFTTKDYGTGLGLAVCYSIANRHSARIDIQTGSLGTTFYVRFSIPGNNSLISQPYSPQLRWAL